MKPKAHFDPKLFQFLRELAKHNDKGWFAANKSRYERDVKGPLLEFIGDFDPLLGAVSKHYVADPRPVGGSMFRIHRDVRFGKDKSPYKTHAAAQFRHLAGKDVHAPGFYLHLEPGEVFYAVGLWRPDSTALRAIREAIVANPAGWQKAAYGKSFRALWSPDGESLQRPPAGFDPGHRFIEDLKRKDFVAVATSSEKAACGPDFLKQFATACRAAAPFMAFLTRAVGLAW
jgi:uncharacterized protein (TIGR02453 family)